MDDVLLAGRVPCSHCFSSCHGDTLSHAYKLLRCGCLVRGILGFKQLGMTKDRPCKNRASQSLIKAAPESVYCVTSLFTVLIIQH